MKTVSIVVSAYNEEGNIEKLYDELKKEIDKVSKVCFEILFVNDGSSDQTFSKIQKLVDLDNRVKMVNLKRNFGHEIAMTAGMDY